MKLLRVPVMAVVYFSVATVLAESGLLIAVAAKNGLDQERLLQLAAVAYDVDLHSMWTKIEKSARPIEKAQVSHEEVVERREQVGLDYDLREMATEKGVRDIHQLGVMLGQERQSYFQLRDEYEIQQQNIAQGAADQKLLDMQLKLQAMQPKQAKDQIIRILDDQEADYERSLQIVVTIIKAMPLDKRKKILAEFKSEEDTIRIHEILRQIRLGVPHVQLIRETREQMQQFESRQ